MAQLNDLISKVATYVEEYINNFDGSHDFNHIKRVLGLSHTLYFSLLKTSPENKLDLNIITLAALLHDVGDRKYLTAGEDSNTLVYNLLLSLGAEENLAAHVQTICAAVRYTGEMKDPTRVNQLMKTYPELAVVQDADRLDAIGAVGIGRVFTYGGANMRDMEGSVELFHEKLLKLESIMKTAPGMVLARERTAILNQFQEWWKSETAVQSVADDVLRKLAGGEGV